MNIITEYRAYLQDNPKGYWFKSKLYGWGWTPVRWQGWLVLLVWVAALFAYTLRIEEQLDVATNTEVVRMFLLPLLLWIGVFFAICFWKGEKPRWQWGHKKHGQD